MVYDCVIVFLPQCFSPRIHGHDILIYSGLSFFQLLSDEFPLIQVAGRLFFDIANDLASPTGQKIVLMATGKMDPLMHNAIKSIIKRKIFMKSLSRGKKAFSMAGYFSWALPIQFIKIYRSNDAAIVQTLMSRNEASIRDLQQRIANLSGAELFAFINLSFEELREAARTNRVDYGVIAKRKEGT